MAKIKNNDEDYKQRGEFTPNNFKPDANGKIRVEYVDEKKRLYRASLNLKKKTKKQFYKYGGTVTMLDRTTKAPLQVEKRNSKTGEIERGPASTEVHIGKIDEDVTGDVLRMQIIKGVEDAAAELAKKYSAQNQQTLRRFRALDDMTLTEAVIAYGDDAAMERSPDEKNRKNYRKHLERLTQELPDKALKSLKKREIAEVLPVIRNGTRLEYLTDLGHLISFAEEKEGVVSAFSEILQKAMKLVKGKDAIRERNNAERRAANSDALSDAAEGIVNEMILKRYQTDCCQIALALIKGGGLSNETICRLRMKDIQRTSSDKECVYINLEQHFSSATQDYTFPLFPWEANLLNDYMDNLRKQYGKNRMQPEKYLLSQDTEGEIPIESKAISDCCRITLHEIVLGYAERLGRHELMRAKGTRQLINTYDKRLSNCGVERANDYGAWLFLRHMQMRRLIQADHYRSFTGESGRQCMYDYVSHDRRFLPPRSKTGDDILPEKGYRLESCLREGNTDCQLLELEIELNPGETLTFYTEHGELLQIASVERMETAEKVENAE